MKALSASAERNYAVALVEVNAETDFVTQNEKFKEFLKEIAQEAADFLFLATVEASAAETL